MKVFFKAIRDYDLEKVKNYVNKKPELVNCVAKAPPKKDDGQSPLQVAFKTANFEIAEFLISKGADVNYIETESINNWRIPVLHDAIRACVFNSRYSVLNLRKTDDGFENIYEIETTKEEFTEALKGLKKLIEYDVNVNAEDSYGNDAFCRLITDIDQITDKKRHTQELTEDLNELISTLFTAGLKIKPNPDYKEYHSELFELISLEI
ncbi:hypothetical protein QSV08_03320 [Maribacter sp. BPC-D8]|uniref:hypothetical protein n=1 Tax=Maribacter sp. BPC-D8 TaxID=3053613 RepID=UPI002B4A3F86|nr:hypothetical protein [Maribacter sp. BPC-D8]WRI30274.1 hypothetical protein QSV08_03320 [Maribacter sp. BPC-D8]